MMINKMAQNITDQNREEIQTLLAAKRKHLLAIKEINDRLTKLGLKPTINQKKPSSKKAPKEKSSPPIKTTVKNMKAFLDTQKIKYSSNATRKDLENILRKHNLVRKCVAYGQD